MGPKEIRRRLVALRAEKRDVERAIGALEELQRRRLARVVELVPHDVAMEAQRAVHRALLLDLVA